MELKPQYQQIIQLRVMCSNRTFMELKQDPSADGSACQVGSNRTFMELKLDVDI